MKPRYISGWIAKRNVDLDTDTGDLEVTVTLELQTDRGHLFLIIPPETAANIGYDLIGEGCGFAYNELADADEEGET